LSNGVALNFKYSPEPGSEELMLKNFVASVEGYFSGNGNNEGGMEIQFNIVNHDTFIEAMKDPDKHRELLVRVSGYTAYFKDLNPRMQKEIVDRTEYLLANGKSVDYPPVALPKEG
jgi:pyruvate-formate lyase